MRSIAEIFRSHAVFDADGRHINGTDKESNHHYGDAYEQIFHRYWPACPRTGPRLMMEIGVAGGASILAWREIFPNATIVGMDIHHSDQAHGDRIEFRIGNQCSKEDCDRVAAGRQFDLIVEDATHVLPNTLLTMLFMWPHVRPGGLYIVEEWDGVGGMRDNIRAIWPNAEVVDTIGPSGGCEPLVVFKKSIGVVCK